MSSFKKMAHAERRDLERLDFRQLPNLMTNRFGIRAGQFLAATPTCGRHARHNVLALSGRDQGSFMFVVARLAATFAT